MQGAVPFLDLPAEYRTLGAEVDEALRRVLDSGAFIQGPDVKALETELAAYVGVPHAITCSSGTDAISLALIAAGVGPGDEVLTTPFTFFATVSTVRWLGATPVFADIDPQSYVMRADLAAKKITKKTKAILAVSLYGQAAAVLPLERLAADHGLAFVEDAAQSFGAEATVGGKTRRSCALGLVGATSFFPTKPLGGIGDGGAVFTADAAAAEDIRCRMNQGQAKRYEHVRLGWNARYDTVQAAVLRVRLRHFAETLASRRAAAARYDALLAAAGLTPPRQDPAGRSAFAQYPVRVKNRDAVAAALQAKGVATAVHYPSPVYAQPALADLGVSPAEYPESEAAARELLCLPMSPTLTADQQERVVAALKDAVRA